MVGTVFDRYHRIPKVTVPSNWLFIKFSLLISHGSSYLAGVTFDRYVILKLRLHLYTDYLILYPRLPVDFLSCVILQGRFVECELIIEGTKAFFSVQLC